MKNQNDYISIASRVIEMHCRRLGIPQSALRARRGRNLAKKHGDVNLSLHRQILALYLEERLPVTKKRIAPHLGYMHHNNILYNIQKAKLAVFKKVDEYVRAYDHLCSYADTITPELDFYQKPGGEFVFNKYE